MSRDLTRREYVLARAAVDGRARDVVEVVVEAKRGAKQQKRITPEQLDAYEFRATVESFRSGFTEGFARVVDAGAPAITEKARAAIKKVEASPPQDPLSIELRAFAIRVHDSPPRRLGRAVQGGLQAAHAALAPIGSRAWNRVTRAASFLATPFRAPYRAIAASAAGRWTGRALTAAGRATDRALINAEHVTYQAVVEVRRRDGTSQREETTVVDAETSAQLKRLSISLDATHFLPIPWPPGTSGAISTVAGASLAVAAVPTALQGKPELARALLKTGLKQVFVGIVTFPTVIGNLIAGAITLKDTDGLDALKKAGRSGKLHR